MEPLAALGLCSSILQIVDFSCKLLSKGNQLRASFSGVLPENEQLEQVIKHLNGLITKLQQQQSSNHMEGLEGIVDLCIQTARELLDVLQHLKIKGVNSGWKSFRAAVKSVWKKEKIEEILCRLELLRDEIQFRFILEMREQLVALVARQSVRFDALDNSTQAVLQAVLDGQVRRPPRARRD